MEDLEQTILGVLNDPEKMQQIMGIAQSLGLSQEQSAGAEQSAAPSLDMLTGLLQQGSDSRKDALFHALMPFLQPDRRKKLQRAMQVARLSRLANFALRQDAADTE